jgi:hypothetical protein
MALKRTVTLLICIFLLQVYNQPVSADVAPPPYPPGSSISPDGQTQVRMLEEHVTLDFDPGNLHDPELHINHAYSDYTISVKADFSMKNLGTSTESMKVRFPLSYKHLSDDLLIDDFQVLVEGSPTPFEKEEYSDDQFQGNMKLWAEFPVTFLRQQEILIQVQYSLKSISKYWHNSVAYVFETGAGWYGTIGKAELIVNLPYEYSPDSILSILPGGSIFGKTIRWTWQDFEPTAKDNFFITLESPWLWNEVVAAKQAILDDPHEGAAYTRLGTLYARIANGGREIAYPEFERLAIDTLKKGAALSPEDPEPHYQLYALYYLEYAPTLNVTGKLPAQACLLLIDELNQILLRGSPSNPNFSTPEQIQAMYNSMQCLNKPALTTLRNTYPTSTPTVSRSPTVDPYIPAATSTPTVKPIIMDTATTTSTPSPTQTFALTKTSSPTTTLPPTVEQISPQTTSPSQAASSNTIPWLLGVLLVVTLFTGGTAYYFRRHHHNSH